MPAYIWPPQSDQWTVKQDQFCKASGASGHIEPLDASREITILDRRHGNSTTVVAEKSVRISNIQHRTNITGDIMDAHDGSYNQWTPGGPWYYYAMGYGTCKQGQDMCHGCGYGYSWIGVWKSPDMSNGTWTLIREARDGSWPNCVYF